MPDDRADALARLLVGRSLDVQPGWQVTVRSTCLARPLVEAVAREIARRSAYALVRLHFRGERIPVSLDWALEAPPELLEELAPIERYALEHDDARLVILAPEDVDALAVLPDERRRAIQRSVAFSRARQFALDVHWVVVQFPTAAAAEAAGMTLAEYEDFVYAACLRDWDAERRRMERIAARLDAADEIRIRGAGTDLTLSIAGREGVVSHGLRNMPDGEIFYSPVEDSAEGTIHYAEFPAIYLGREVVGARLRFESGRVVDASAERGEADLIAILDTDEGARRVGELGFGCNEQITRYTRNVLLDEKMGGTVHLALGASYTYAGGTNESAIHWDMVKDLRPGGEILADGEVIQRDGRWTGAAA